VIQAKERDEGSDNVSIHALNPYHYTIIYFNSVVTVAFTLLGLKVIHLVKNEIAYRLVGCNTYQGRLLCRTFANSGSVHSDQSGIDFQELLHWFLEVDILSKQNDIQLIYQAFCTRRIFLHCTHSLRNMARMMEQSIQSVGGSLLGSYCEKSLCFPMTGRLKSQMSTISLGVQTDSIR
jgi:hypothetical protein